MSYKKILSYLIVSLFIFLFAACDEDNPAEPVLESATFTVTIENVSTEYPFIRGGSFSTPAGASEPGPAFAGDKFEVSFNAGPGHKLSFATMFGQSNDFFYAPDGDGIDLFDMSGSQVTGDVTSQVYLWDAGTEINQEPGLGADQAPRQSGGNTGAADPVNTVRMAPDDFGNLPAVSDVIKVTLTSTSATGFMLTIENVSTATTLQTSDGGAHPTPIAPGMFVIHSGSNPLFTSGMADFGLGLEHLAEDGDFSVLADDAMSKTGLTSPFAPGAYGVFSGSAMVFTTGQPDPGEGIEELAEDGSPANLASALAARSNVKMSGSFTTPVGASGAGPLFPGHTFEFTFTAEEGDMLFFATMFGQSNDIFAGTSPDGISLFTGGSAIMGDITSQISFWDAGTEVNEIPGIGLNQAPRQSGTNTGAAENGNVKLLSDVNDGFSYPSVGNTLKVTISAQ